MRNGQLKPEKEEIQAVVKYGSYPKEKGKAWKGNVGKIENWTYDEVEDKRQRKQGKHREVVVSLERLRYQNQTRKILFYID